MSDITRAARNFVKDANQSAEYAAAVEWETAQTVAAINRKLTARVYNPQADEDNDQAAQMAAWRPTPIAWGRLAAYLGWLCLFGIAVGTLVAAGLVRDLRVAVAGVGLAVLLVAAARKGAK